MFDDAPIRDKQCSIKTKHAPHPWRELTSFGLAKFFECWCPGLKERKDE